MYRKRCPYTLLAPTARRIDTSPFLRASALSSKTRVGVGSKAIVMTEKTEHAAEGRLKRVEEGRSRREGEGGIDTWHPACVRVSPRTRHIFCASCILSISSPERGTLILLSDKHLHSVCSRIASGYRFEDHRSVRERRDEPRRG